MTTEKSHPAPTVLPVQRASTVDLIATELRNAVFTGGLPVGGPLGELEIAKELGVSRGPLREAIQRLVQEGILVSTPGRGPRVGTVGSSQLKDLYDARLAIESHAAVLVIRRGDRAATTKIEDAFGALAEASGGTQARAIGDADLDFHWAIVEASGNSRLLRYMSTLIVETRMASYSVRGDYVVRRDISPSHEAILEAILDSDEERVQTVLEAHMYDAVARLSGKLPSEGGVELIEQPVETLEARLEPISRRD